MSYEVTAPYNPIPLAPSAEVTLSAPAASELTLRQRIARGLAAGTLAIGLLAGCSNEGSVAAQPSAAASAPSPEMAPSPNNTSEDHSGLLASSDPNLQLIGAYEKDLGVKISEVMYFTYMPDAEHAAAAAEDTAQQIKDSAAAGVTPRFIMEPLDADGQSLDITRLGQRLRGLEAYFQALKEKGVTDEQMGTWVPLPEPSLPDEWKGGTDPKIFAHNFNGVAGLIKRIFPKAKVGMMLDSASFPDGTWGSRTYDSNALLAYTNGIEPNLVDELGLQGFPRVSGSTDPHKLIQSSVALQAATRVGAKSLWVNTGTYARENDPDSGRIVDATPEQRQAFLKGVAQEVSAMRGSGMSLTVTVFAQDKLNQGEASWNYGPAEVQTVLKPFAQEITGGGASFSIFDARG